MTGSIIGENHGITAHLFQSPYYSYKTIKTKKNTEEWIQAYLYVATGCTS